MAERLRMSLDGGPDGPWRFYTDPDAKLAPGSLDGARTDGRPITVPAPWQSQGDELPRLHGRRVVRARVRAAERVVRGRRVHRAALRRGGLPGGRLGQRAARGQARGRLPALRAGRHTRAEAGDEPDRRCESTTHPRSSTRSRTASSRGTGCCRASGSRCGWSGGRGCTSQDVRVTPDARAGECGSRSRSAARWATRATGRSPVGRPAARDCAARSSRRAEQRSQRASSMRRVSAWRRRSPSCGVSARRSCTPRG